MVVDITAPVTHSSYIKSTEERRDWKKDELYSFSLPPPPPPTSLSVCLSPLGLHPLSLSDCKNRQLPKIVILV